MLVSIAALVPAAALLRLSKRVNFNLLMQKACEIHRSFVLYIKSGEDFFGRYASAK
jgi:hypothetical protein